MYYPLKGRDGEMRLDKDDTRGNGHETLTLDRLRPDVCYWFGAHHFSGEGSFASSNATIEVYGLTAGILAKSNLPGADTSPFKMAVPRTQIEGCGSGAVWQGVGLTPNGSGGFRFLVANKLLVSRKFSDNARTFR